MKSFKVIILIILLSFSFTGCVSTQNLKDLDVVEGVTVDYKDKEFSVSIQTLNLTKSGSGAEALSGNITKNVEGKGSTISEAVSDCSKELSKKLFFGHNAIVVLGKGLIDEGVKKSLDYLLRSVDSRPDVIVAMSKEDASKIIECTQNDSLVPMENVASLLEVGEKAGLGSYTTVKDLMNDYSFETSDISLSMLETREKDKKTNCIISGIAIFSEDEYKTTLSKAESMGLLFINNKVENGSFSIQNTKFGNIGVEIISSGSDVKVYVKNNEVYVDIVVETTYMVDEIEKGYLTNLTSEKFKEISSLCEKEIEGYCRGAITTAFSNGCDVFNIGKRLSGKDKEFFETVKDDWRKNLQSINVSVKADCTLEKVNDNSIRQ